jgi:hypothetical protein
MTDATPPYAPAARRTFLLINDRDPGQKDAILVCRNQTLGVDRVGEIDARPDQAIVP